MELTGGRDRGSIAQGLREFAQILEGEPLLDVVDRRATKLKEDLAALYLYCRGQGIADHLKQAAWAVGVLTIEGREEIVRLAKGAVARLGGVGESEPRVSWRDVARLPTIDREFLDRTARQCRFLADLLSEQDPPAVKGGDSASDGAPELSAEERALALLVRHPEWTQTKMAEAVGVSRQTLYRFSQYQTAREALESGRTDIPRGFKDADGNLEAWECDTFCDTENDDIP